MANIFTLKHGSGVPDHKLYPFELGFDEIGKKLYIGGATTSSGELGSAIPIIPTLSDLGITATTEELNKLDGLTATTAELNKLKGLTATTAELNILDGITATTSELNILDGVTATATEINRLDGITATTAELNYIKGVTSSIQTQLNGKEPTINLTASRALVSNSSGKVAVSAVTSTELGYLDGVTSAIQTQLNGKEPTISLTASRALVSNSSGKVAVSAVTSKELGYLDGVTSNIQTQLNNKAICTLIASGKTLNSSNTTFTITGGANYSAYIIFGYTTGGSVNGYVSLFIPRSFVNETARRFVMSDVAQAKTFTLKISGEDLVVTNVGYAGGGISEGSVYVYGLT